MGQRQPGGCARAWNQRVLHEDVSELGSRVEAGLCGAWSTHPFSKMAGHLRFRSQQEMDFAIRGRRQHRCGVQKSNDYARRLIRFWFVAQSLGDTALQDTITDELARWWIAPNFVVLLDQRTLAFVDKRTSRGSPLRRFFIDWATCIDSGRKTVEKQIKKGKFKKEELPRWLPHGEMLFGVPEVRGSSVDILKLNYHVS